jgi:threonine dehydrogenase-like Zn-dependent dehydrogenase
MKAAVFKGAGHPLCIATMSDPVPGASEIIVKVGLCGICGTDLSMTALGEFNYPVGSSLGHEFSGEVIALGREVDQLKIGDMVVAMPVAGCGRCQHCRSGDLFWCAQMRPMMGGFGEYAVAAAGSCLLLPAGLSATDGAIIEPLAVGLHSVHQAGMRQGARVMILGSGPIALATAFWARRLGAAKVTLMSRSDRHSSIAAHMGVTDFMTFTSADEEMRLLAEDGLPEIVFECVGASAMLARAIALVAPRGTVVLSGLCFCLDSFVPAAAVFKEVRVQAALGYRRSDFIASLDVLSAGAIQPRAMVTNVIALDDLPDKFEAMRTQKHECKVLVDPSRAAHLPH